MQDAQQVVFFDAALLGGAPGHADALHVASKMAVDDQRGVSIEGN
ncbi:hypothetical protein [Paenibacillus oryzisoli]|nr:hypothetical protein [Paenibacillus oryzisoli]